MIIFYFYFLISSSIQTKIWVNLQCVNDLSGRLHLQHQYYVPNWQMYLSIPIVTKCLVLFGFMLISFPQSWPQNHVSTFNQANWNRSKYEITSSWTPSITPLPSPYYPTPHFPTNHCHHDLFYSPWFNLFAFQLIFMPFPPCPIFQIKNLSKPENKLEGITITPHSDNPRYFDIRLVGPCTFPSGFPC